MDKEKSKLALYNNVYLIYSLVYTIFAIAVLIIFILKRKTFVWLDDGISQNLIELKSSSEFLKSLFLEDIYYSNYNLIDNNVFFRFFYWGIRNVLGLLVTDNQYLYLYLFYYILQTYTSGIFFILFCKSKEVLRECSINAILIGTMVYVFTGYSFYTMKQVEFGYVMAVMPLLFILIDRILDKGKGLAFSIFITIVILLHIPYFYPLTLIMAIYILFSVVERVSESNFREYVIYCVKKIVFVIGWWSLGVAASGIFLVPIAYGIKNSTRMEIVISTASLWHYDFQIYLSMVFDSFEPSTSTHMILPSFIIWGVLYLLLKKEKLKEEASASRMMFLSILLYMIPLWGLAAKGFANISNYWYFGMIFFMAYGMVYASKDLMEHANFNLLLKPLIGSFVYILAFFLLKKDAAIKSYAVWFLILSIFIILIKEEFRYKWVTLTTVVFINCLCLFFISTYRLIDNFLDLPISLPDYYGQFVDSASESIEDPSFYRIEKYLYTGEFNTNLPQWYGYNGTSVFHSSLMKEICVYLNKTENNGYVMNNKISGLDGRSMALALANVKYDLIPENNEDFIPYGYSEYKYSQGYYNDTNIYINKKALPFGYTYASNSWINQDKVKHLNGLELQEIMMQVPIVENEEVSSELSNCCISNTGLDYKIIENPEVDIVEDTIHILKKNAWIDLQITCPDNSELYIRFKDIYPDDKTKVFNVSCGGIKKQAIQYHKKEFHKINRDNVLINLGYKKQGGQYICSVQFLSPGEYSLNDIRNKMEVYAQKLDSYDRYIEELSYESLNIEEMTGRYVKGNISVSNDKWICFSVPYSSGWKIYIDGELQDSQKLNYVYLGTIIPKGDHIVELRYSVPGLHLGLFISIIGITVMLSIAAFSIFYKREQLDNEKNL